MSRAIQIFLGYCFADHRVNRDGHPDPAGLSNLEIGAWFQDHIARLGGARVQVAVTANPITRRISEQVKRSIEESDAAIFIFPKRVQCPYHGWTTSQYVISESGYAAARFRHETEKRLFAFYEHGVNRDALGLAFPMDRVIPLFHRDNLAGVHSTLTEVIQEIIKDTPDATDDPEPLLLKKIVRVRRDGRATIESTYRFRIRRDSTRFRMRHTLWRVRKKLPDLSRMRDTAPGDGQDYFICLPTICGAPPNAGGEIKLDWFQPAKHGKEIGFRVEMSNVALSAGDTVEYQFEYSYGDAFFDAADIESWERNSTGLRTGGRGTVREAMLVVAFERNWNKGVKLPTIELEDGQSGPAVATAKETGFPSLTEPQEFWHRNTDVWHSAGCMEPCHEDPSPRWENYTWRRENFSGLAKATWQPTFNYHQGRGGKSRNPRPNLDEGDEMRE